MRARVTNRFLDPEWTGAALILAAAAALRFWDLDGRPGYEWDEPVYTDVASHAARDGAVEIKPQFGEEPGPYLFHPPVYFHLLGLWFRIFGIGIVQARFLAAFASLVVLALLYLLLRAHLGRLALIPLALVATDGWIVYTNRIGWIENTMLVLGLGGLLVYDRAFRAATAGRGHSLVAFAGAGLLLGGATVYKHVGGYLVAAVAVHWLVRRRLHREHAVLLATAALVVVAYVAGMTLVYQNDGQNAFLEHSNVQVERALGGHERRGTVESPTVALGAIIDQYRIFYATLGLTLIATIALVYRLIEAVRVRTLEHARRNALLFSWALAAVVSFGLIKLRFPHYMIMLLVPLYAFLASELVRVARSEIGIRVLAFGAVAVVQLNMLTFANRFVHRADNALAAVRDYAREEIPREALILTEETVGMIVPQPYCKLVEADRCQQAAFVILYTSHTQRPPREPALAAILREARLEATFRGFKETIRVYRTLAGSR